MEMLPLGIVSSRMNRVRFALLFVLTVVGVMVGACGSTASSSPSGNAADLLKQGLQAQLAGNLSTAESDYKKVIQLDSRNKWAHYNLGTVYDQQGMKSQAISEYQTTLSIDQNFTNAIFNLAVDTATADPPGAEALYRRVIAIDPQRATAWLNLGFVLLAEGKSDEARANWDKAIAIDPSLTSRIPAASAVASPSSASASPSPAR